jgi:hypothetical protein
LKLFWWFEVESREVSGLALAWVWPLADWAVALPGRQ